MNTMLAAAVAAQILLLVYHQVTTTVDLFPFNGARFHRGKERIAECAVNGVLMSLGPIGFAFHVSALMTFGVIYYFVLFAIEVIIWWVPYLTVPSGRWRSFYNLLLAFGNGDFARGDTLSRWVEIHDRIHRGTIALLPAREGRPVPNLEHTILHAWTLVTALVTAVAWRHLQ
jgi:hypothetical protein